MSNNESLKSGLTFKSTDIFRFKGTDELFQATVKLTTSEIVRVLLHDFKASFTLQQAYEVASGLMKATINYCEIDGKNSEMTQFQASFDLWNKLICQNVPFGSSDLLRVMVTGRKFLTQGALLDPEPVREFKNGEEPIYDFKIMLDGQNILMCWGWVGWSLSHREALWLAEQLFTSVFLATKPKRS